MSDAMDALSSTLRAVSDPTRRTILELLKERSRSVNDLARHFSMSRPAVSKHLGILREAELVISRREGRQQIYELEAGALAPARDWLDRHVAGNRRPEAEPVIGPRPPVRSIRRLADPRRDDWRCW